MNKLLKALLCAGLIFGLVGCGSSSDGEENKEVEEETTINPPIDSDDISDGLFYDEIRKEFEDAGFTNVKGKALGDLVAGILHDESEIETISIDGSEEFDTFDDFEPDAKVLISYHSYPEEKAIDDAESEGIINASNNAEFAEILTLSDPFDNKIQSFANTHTGQNIEYDGNVTSILHHGDYKTRYDYLVLAGDYNPNSAIGPSFQFENVNYNDLNLTGDNVPDSLVEGTNIHIIAKIQEYDPSTGLFKLDPISVKLR